MTESITVIDTLGPKKSEGKTKIVERVVEKRVEVPVSVDSYLVEFTESVNLFIGGQYITQKAGSKIKVSKAVKDILIVRGCVKHL